MTTTQPGYLPPPPPSRPAPRVLRRSRTNRVGAGVAGGLGEYFGVDPVLFRVLFATAAFFGGAGVLAYLVAWVAIPDEGTEHATIDSWIGQLRRHRIPAWVVVLVAAIVFWAVALSWWAPRPFFPIMVVVIVLVAIFARGSGNHPVPPPAYGDPGSYGPWGASPASWGGGGGSAPTSATMTSGSAATGPVNLEKSDPAATTDSFPTAEGYPTADYPTAGGPASQPPTWSTEARRWLDESRAASRLRRRRALPVRLATIVTLVVTLAILAIIDAAGRLPLTAYLWATLAIVGTGLLVGVVLRRTPWSLSSLLVPAIIGTIAFGGSTASLSDGIGQQQWTPTTNVASNYRLAFGQGVLDLRSAQLGSTARTINVTIAAGQAQIIVPSSMNVTVDTHVRFGNVTVDGRDADGLHSSGVDVDRTVNPLTGATGPAVTIDVHVADGNVQVDHR
jgi:phage shock protein PspC (stress-responsive transcriptional regulator)